MLCTNDNKKELLDFLLRKPTENCFFIGDAGKLYKKIGFQDVGKWSIGTVSELEQTINLTFPTAVQSNLP